MGVAAEERQVINDRDIYEMVSLLDDPGNGFQITATISGKENIWGGLSGNKDKHDSKVIVTSLEKHTGMGPKCCVNRCSLPRNVNLGQNLNMCNQ